METVRVEHIKKVYPGTIALEDINVSFESGKVNALVGKNGSGKSTLLKIIAGAVPRTEGKVYIKDKEVNPKNTYEAYSMGIATVFQELSIIPGITVAENILIGRIPTKKNGLVNHREMFRKAGELLDELGIDIDPKVFGYQLSACQLQMVEIAKAMSYNPEVLQLDEPTSSLSQKEVNALFRIIRKLKEKDVTIIYVSHRLQELWDICDTCTVFRDGHFIKKLEMKDTTRAELLGHMFGNVEIPPRATDFKTGEKVLLELRDFGNGNKFNHINLKLYEGEVLGIAGMLGSGRTELLRAIFGADPHKSGEIFVEGKLVKKPNPERMKDLGVAMLQEDRKRDGIIAEETISNNLVLANIKQLGKGTFVNKRLEKQIVGHLIKKYEIKIGRPQDSMSSLSGGNQQKVIVARWMNTNPKICMFDEPSRGIDVASKQQIFYTIWDMARQGISSIMVSSELEELLSVCSRILIMKNGSIVEEMNGDEIDSTSPEELYLRCM